jgi:hypothetical protein
MTHKKLISLEKDLIKLKREEGLNLVDRNSIIEVQKIIDSLLRDKEAFLDKFGVMNK